MTTPRYPTRGCPAGSQVPGEASGCRLAAAPDYAWIVNFNHGNVNNNHRNNNARVRAVRAVVAPRECRSVSYRGLYRAYIAARRGKQPSANQLAFTADWGAGLIALQQQLEAGTWSPRPTTCFVAQRPKAREIHAPDFADRVVHHWLVPQLEAIYEPTFIADSYANRTGKGTHAAVERLRTFVRQVHSGQGGGWYLQLDIHNFFNSIHRPTLWAMLKRRMTRHAVPQHVQRACHALLRQSPATTGTRTRATPAQLETVPAHKRLANAAPGCGLPIGNLSSQFFANVYLDRLDQYVKHTLRAKRYLRYVDDFVLVHHDRDQLRQWQAQIETFLQDQLRLRFKPDIRLRRLTDGVDFLGYVVYPTHTRVRRRVLRHASTALRTWQRAHVAGATIRATPDQLRAIQSTWASYTGHLRHANSHRLQQRIHARYPWLHAATLPRRLPHTLEGRPLRIQIRRLG